MRTLATLLLVLGLAAPAPVAAQDGLDIEGVRAEFLRVSERDALPGAFAVSGSAVAWASPTQGAVELLVRDLADGEERVVTRIADPGELQIGSLAFDGRWVVWTDDRFGDFEVFSADLETGALNRLSQNPADDRNVVADRGRALWDRLSALHMASLDGSETVRIAEGVGPSPSADLDGDLIVWSQPDGRSRLIGLWGKDLPEPVILSQGGETGRLRPRLDGQQAVWMAIDLPPPGQPTEGLEVVIQLANLSLVADGERVSLDRSEIVNLTGPTPDVKDPQLGGGRVAWLVRAPVEGDQLFVRHLESGLPFVVGGPVGGARLSDEYLVLHRASGGPGPLYAHAWVDPASLLEPGGLDWRMVAVGVLGAALVVSGIVWGRGRRD